MSEVDDAIASARASWSRISDDRGAVGAARMPTRARARNTQAIGKRLTRIVVADAVILIAAMVIGWVVPLGIGGAMLVMALLVAATLLFAVWPAERAPTPERLASVDIKALPRQTERWLEAQRPALPAPAVTLVDRIGLRLETLAPQLARFADDAPEAIEVRKLVGEQLPAFVKEYERVPQALRTTPRNGRTPDAELVAGLSLIEQEIGEMTQRLAQDDLDTLATRGRFLEMKYRDET
ncbi:MULTISPECIES: hypothetical protein [unclassified Sphingomonas]|uniref:hypothetical protein n=1 Tax=unclassified Sphingomonas TaxID=196159 RepID=UPI0006FCF110|nr:hypothetical protein [Sphingomonas sp. Leaf30]KQN22029.1 hypothetical protein ASE89_03585 [Sphingomonas sp. Leaf30]MBD8549777.1 hypothetical protein [Sphingomonas sp. CFBP 8764]